MIMKWECGKKNVSKNYSKKWDWLQLSASYEDKRFDGRDARCGEERTIRVEQSWFGN